MDSIKRIININFFVLTLLSIIVIVSCRPSKDVLPGLSVLEIAEYDEDINQAVIEKVKFCYEDEDLMELCQRCAKVTKSNIVFPMCCAREDGSTKWCEEYVYYGIQK